MFIDFVLKLVKKLERIEKNFSYRSSFDFHLTIWPFNEAISWFSQFLLFFTFPVHNTELSFQVKVGIWLQTHYDFPAFCWVNRIPNFLVGHTTFQGNLFVVWWQLFRLRVREVPSLCLSLLFGQVIGCMRIKSIEWLSITCRLFWLSSYCKVWLFVCPYL